MESFETQIKRWAAKMKERDERWVEQSKNLQAKQKLMDGILMEQDQLRKDQIDSRLKLEETIRTSIDALTQLIKPNPENQPVSPTSFSFNYAGKIQADGSACSAYSGETVPRTVEYRGVLGTGSDEGTVDSLNDMNGKCGTTKNAIQVIDRMPSPKPVSNLSQGAAQQEYELFPTSQAGYGSQVAKAQLREGLVSEAIHADDAIQFLEVIHAADIYKDWERNPLIVRQKTNEPKVDSELIFAYAEIDKLGEIDELILRPKMANLKNVVRLIE